MKVSTRGRYALRLMLDLALNNTGEPVRLKDEKCGGYHTEGAGCDHKKPHGV